VIQTTNESWGFYGTLVSNGATDAAQTFDAAARALVTHLGLRDDQARELLDAKIGRHLADQRRAGEGGKDLVERLLAKKGWERDIRTAARQADRKEIRLVIPAEEVAILEYALGSALSAISEAHPADRAQLKSLIARLEAAQR